jgi:hypothetical protein
VEPKDQTPDRVWQRDQTDFGAEIRELRGFVVRHRQRSTAISGDPRLYSTSVGGKGMAEAK